MISLLPLIMLLGYGYLLYRWAASTSARNVARRSKDDTRHYGSQVRQRNREADQAAKEKTPAAAAAGGPF